MKARLKLRRAATNGASAGEVYDQIWSAIIDNSLPPETRLVEERLCEIFGVGRTRLRQVLQRLAHERVVTLMPNRGAMVSKPSVREAREVFAARGVLEAGTVAGFIDTASRADCRRLQDHVLREQSAWKQSNRRAALKLSGEFHLLIAQIAGNQILCELLRDLISRSSLIIAVYQTPAAACCPPDEHRELATLLERREPRAADLMIQHLDRVLADLRLEKPADTRVDLRLVFANLNSRRAL
ncbi:MAG TPA: GntR family transcriptional regulator [Steroidobacteraceae bacterium]|jgi:DNA-binding GntR family transcriptional regulator